MILFRIAPSKEWNRAVPKRGDSQTVLAPRVARLHLMTAKRRRDFRVFKKKYARALEGNMNMDAKPANSFRSAAGKTYSFDNDFYHFHLSNYGHRDSVANVSETSINIAGGSDKINYARIKEKFSSKETSIKTLQGYVSRVVPTYQLLELFRDTYAGRPSGKILDIGCGRGVHLRLLKAWGYIEEAVGIDIYDHCTGFDESCLPRLHRKFKLLRFAEAIQDRIALKPRSAWSEVEYLIMQRFPTVRRFSSDYGHRPGPDIYKISMRHAPRMDRFIAGNVFDIDEKFDVVTSFASLDWFPAQQIIGKIANLLKTGGFFYVWVTSWWHAINTTNVFGHFPFLAQRLSREDFERYIQDFFPERAGILLKSYAYFDKSRPTLADLVDYAGEHGLIPLAWKQNVLPDVARPRGGLSSLAIAKLDHDEFMNSHLDAQSLKPGLRQVDMLPFSNAVLFQKIDRTSRLDKRTLDDAAAALERPTPSSSRMTQFLKDVGSRLYRRSIFG